MTRKENLIALRDAVVGGDADANIFRDIWHHEKVFTMETAIGIKRTCFNGDMNAALAFVAEVLPGWLWAGSNSGADGNRPLFMVGKVVKGTVDDRDTFEASADTPARALLIAALNALIEETDE